MEDSDISGKSAHSDGQTPNRPLIEVSPLVEGNDQGGEVDETERAAAVANLLDFLEREDKEDSDERARNRGESISTFNKDLYVVKEEVTVPESGSPARQTTDRKS